MTATPPQGLLSPRFALGLLLAINLFNYLDRQVLAAVVPKLREEFFGADTPADGGVAMQVVGWLQGVFGFKPESAMIGSLNLAFMAAYMCLAPLFGWLGERRGRWLIVGCAVIAWSIATGGSGWAMSFGVLFLTRCLVGVGEAGYGPIAPALLSDLFPASQRGKVMAWFYMAIPVGSALGYVVGSFVMTNFGWRYAFYAVVPPGILLGILCFFMRDPRRGGSDPNAVNATRPTRLSDYLTLLKTPSYVLCTLGMTAMTFALGGIGFWMPDFIHQQGEKSENVGMIFGGIVVVGGFLATMTGGWLGDRLRGRYPSSYFLISGISMLVGFPAAVAMIYCPFPYNWGVIFVACFCLFFNTGPTNTILANVTHPSVRAGAFALTIFVIHAFGDAVSPLLIGLIADKYDMQKAFLLVAAAVLVGGVLWLWGCRYLQRDTELAATRIV